MEVAVEEADMTASLLMRLLLKFNGIKAEGKSRSSSAAGLIATVDKEPEIGEFCNDKWFLAMKNLQAGALMFADYGICCVHVFDDMDIKNQVSDHQFLISTEDEFSWTMEMLVFQLLTNTAFARQIKNTCSIRHRGPVSTDILEASLSPLERFLNRD
ncbi:hypothetical protein YC2023_075811 [Brassica napus]